MSRALYYLRHRNPPEVFPITRVLFFPPGAGAAAIPVSDRFNSLESAFKPLSSPNSTQHHSRICRCLTNPAPAETIEELYPSASGPVAQLGARFHGMEEVIGSI